MQSPLHHGVRSWCFPLCALSIFCFSLLSTAEPPDGERPVRVLALTYGDKEAPGLILMIEQLEARLERDLKRPVWVSVESYGEAAAGHDEQYQKLWLQLLARKYGSEGIDLIVAFGVFPLELISRYQNELLPHTPRLYFALGQAPSQSYPHTHGYVWKFNFAPTVELALAQNPDAKHLLLVYGQEDLDRTLVALAMPTLQEGVRHSGRSVSIDSIPNGTFAAMCDQLKHLPADVVPIFITFHRDSAGKSFIPARVVSQFSAASSRPLYGIDTAYIGRGIIGGSLADFATMADQMGKMGAEIIRGNPPSTEAQIMPDLRSVIFDWKEMKRFGMRTDQLPAGSQVINREPGAWELYKQYILLGLSLLAVQALLIILLLRQRYTLRRDQEHIQDLSSRLIHAQDDERAHIARELHDGINQELAMVTMDLQKIDAALPDSSSRSTVQQVWRQIIDVSNDLQKMSHNLHSVKLAHLGLVTALKGLTQEVATHEQIEVTFETHQVPERVPDEVSLAMFRVAQEALRNASRHGKAKLVNVVLSFEDGWLTLSIEDHGQGFDVSRAARGLGLMSMQERMRLLHGRLKLLSSPFSGTSIHASAPVPTAARAKSA
jgi:signal transduction histidine kinase